MSWPKKIQVVGLNHRTAPVEVRESLAFARARLPEALSLACRESDIEEAVILSTCNRVEVYLCSRGVEDEDYIKHFLASFHGLKAESFEDHLYKSEHQEAVSHLFRVASGLDSMVLGETQVTAQVKEAYRIACQEHTAGRMLHRLFQQSLAVAKKVRTSTEIGSGRASVGSVAVQLAQSIFETLDNRTVLLVGAGKMGEIVLRSLRAAGAKTTFVANRTFAHAETLAREYGGSAVHFDKLAENMARADIVISSTDAPHYVVRYEDVKKALRARSGRSIFLIDIAVPRDIDPAITEIEGIYLYNMDDLQSVVDETTARRRQELNRCLTIVGEEASKFMHWAYRLQVGPTVAELRDNLHDLKRHELCALLQRLPGVTDADRQAIEQMADRLVNKILHVPIKALREPSSQEHGRGVLAAARRLFGLTETTAESFSQERGLSGGEKQ